MTRLEEIEAKVHGEYKAEKAGKGKRVQIYACDETHRVVWAGPHHVRRPSLRNARRLQRRWREWRYLYDNAPENIDQDYPAKHSNTVHYVGIETPNGFVWFKI